MVVAAFVAPYLLEATARFALSAARVPGVRLGLITTESAENLSPELRDALAGHWQVGDALDPQQIADAVRGLSGQIGPVERLIGALEQLQVPLAQVRDALGIPGMDEDTAQQRPGQVADEVGAARVPGIPCARHQLVTRTEEATGFLAEVGSADGGQAAGRRRGAGHLPAGHRSRLRLLAAAPRRPTRPRSGCSRSS